MQLRTPQTFPLVGALVAFWAFIALMVFVNVARSGAFTYNLDDPYIHLAIARNWADYGVWGVTRYEFGSSTSSLLWTATLGVLMKLGAPAREWLPFALNLLFGTLTIWHVHRWWRGAVPDLEGEAQIEIGARSWRVSRAALVGGATFLLLLLFIFITPLPILVQNGMEHLLQILLTLLVALYTGRVAASERREWGREGWLLLLWIPLSTATRYENLFLVAAVMLVLAWRRRWGLAAAVLVASLLPLLLYGWISVQNGWYPLPNSVLVKSGFTIHGWQDILLLVLGRNAIERLLFAESHAVLPLVALAVAALLGRSHLAARPSLRPAERVTGTVLVLFLWTLLLHSMFNSSPAGISSGRYTGYLYALALGALGFLLLQWVARATRTTLRFSTQSAPALLTVTVVTLLLAFPFVARAGREVYQQWYGSSNIYEQQIQMARFLNRYYNGASIAANDIGAINYFADIRCLDLIGLGTLQVAEESRDGSFVTADIDRVARAHGVTAAILYDKWFPPGSHVAPPDHWITVAHWTIPDNVVASAPTVTFYATSPAEAEQMRQHLDEFASQLPERVSYAPAGEETP